MKFSNKLFISKKVRKYKLNKIYNDEGYIGVYFLVINDTSDNLFEIVESTQFVNYKFKDKCTVLGIFPSWNDSRDYVKEIFEEVIKKEINFEKMKSYYS